MQTLFSIFCVFLVHKNNVTHFTWLSLHIHAHVYVHPNPNIPNTFLTVYLMYLTHIFFPKHECELEAAFVPARMLHSFDEKHQSVEVNGSKLNVLKERFPLSMSPQCSWSCSVLLRSQHNKTFAQAPCTSPRTHVTSHVAPPTYFCKPPCVWKYGGTSDSTTTRPKFIAQIFTWKRWISTQTRGSVTKSSATVNRGKRLQKESSVSGRLSFLDFSSPPWLKCL